MKLCRFGPKGEERPGLVDNDLVIRDLSNVIDDVTPQVLSDNLERLSQIDPRDLPEIKNEERLGVPVNGIQKIIGIGLNYADHAEEAGLPIPTEPIVFMKAISSLTGPNDEVVLPRSSSHSDWEVELGVVIGHKGRYVEESAALGLVAGYVLVNDVSERFDQMKRGTQWCKGKGHDTFCPTGPWLVTADDVPDPQVLDMHLDLNGGRMQTGNTSSMIFSVSKIIAYVSKFMTLYPGDLIITGTPPGVGDGKKPEPCYLKPGDVMKLGITGLGAQIQHVAEWPSDRRA